MTSLNTWKIKKNYLKDLKSYSNSYVAFGDRAKGKIVGMGNLDYPGLPSLDVGLLVEGLSIKLISINHPCDQELCGNFNHYECTITNKRLEKIINGTR